MPTVPGSVAEWSKALALGTSFLGGVGSNPTTATNLGGLVAWWLGHQTCNQAFLGSTLGWAAIKLPRSTQPSIPLEYSTGLSGWG